MIAKVISVFLLSISLMSVGINLNWIRLQFLILLNTFSFYSSLSHSLSLLISLFVFASLILVLLQRLVLSLPLSISCLLSIFPFLSLCLCLYCCHSMFFCSILLLSFSLTLPHLHSFSLSVSLTLSLPSFYCLSAIISLFIALSFSLNLLDSNFNFHCLFTWTLSILINYLTPFTCLSFYLSLSLCSSLLHVSFKFYSNISFLSFIQCHHLAIKVTLPISPSPSCFLLFHLHIQSFSG